MTLTPNDLCAAQRASGTMGSLFKKRRGNFYDANLLPSAGTNQLTFFVNPLGQADAQASGFSLTGGLATKTKEQTNVTRQRQLQDDLWLTSIAFDIRMWPKQRQAAGIVADADAIFTTYRDVMDDLLDLAGKGVLSIKFNNSLFYEIPLPFFLCPPGYGPEVVKWAHGAAAPAAGSAYATYFQLSNDPGKKYVISPMQFIEREQNLEVTIDFPNGNTPALSTVSGAAPRVEARCFLEGHRAMAVQ